MKLKLSMYILFFVLLTGCGSTKINQFAKFSAAGFTYTEALDELVDEVADTAIDADTISLVKARKGLKTQKERGDEIIASTKRLKNQLNVLGDLKRHVFLLKKYFLTLGRLTESEFDEAIANNASALVTEIQNFSPKLRDADINGTNINQLVNPLTNAAIRKFRLDALNEHFTEERVKTIGLALETHEALLTLLAEKIRDDQEDILAFKETEEIDRPFRNKGDLPKKWMENRKAVLSNRISLASADNAVEAASSLKKAFLALVTTNSGEANIDDVFADINEILDLVDLVKSEEL